MNEETKTKYFCPNCGAESETDVGFCGSCGGRLDGEPTQTAADKNISIDMSGIVNGASAAASAAKNAAAGAAETVKKMPKKKVITIAAIAAALLIVIAMIAGITAYNSAYTTIDMEKAFDIEYVGLNGGAKAVPIPNSEYLAERIAKIMDIEPDKIEDLNLQNFNYGNLLSSYYDTLKLTMLFESMKIECSPKENLSNGDKVTVTVTCDEDAFKENKIKIKNTSFTVKVSGLSEGTDYDIFKDVKISFSGVSPFLKIDFDTSACDEFVKDYVTFDMEGDSRYLKNGDTVTITAVYNESEAADRLYVIKETSKQYTVSGQAEYLSSVEGVDTTALMNEINDQAEAKAASLIGWYFGNIGYVKSATLDGIQSKWLLNQKSTNTYGDKNRFIAIYKCNVASDNDSAVYYIIIKVNSIVKNADGSITWDRTYAEYSDNEYTSVLASYVNSNKSDFNVTEIK